MSTAEAKALKINGMTVDVNSDRITAHKNSKILWQKEAAQKFFPDTLRQFKNYVMVNRLETGAFTTIRKDIFDAQKGFITSVGEKYLGEFNGQLLFLEKEAPGLETRIAPDIGLNIFSLKTLKTNTTLLKFSLNPKKEIIDSCKLSSVFLFSFDSIGFIKKGKDNILMSAKNNSCQFQLLLNPEKSQLYVSSFKKIH